MIFRIIFSALFPSPQVEELRIMPEILRMAPGVGMRMDLEGDKDMGGQVERQADPSLLLVLAG